LQEADEDELEEDEQPEWKREPPKVDMSKLNPDNPEEFVKLSKKGRTLMMFATVAGTTPPPFHTHLHPRVHVFIYLFAHFKYSCIFLCGFR
jgi:hypothetical protein